MEKYKKMIINVFKINKTYKQLINTNQLKAINNKVMKKNNKCIR